MSPDDGPPVSGAPGEVWRVGYRPNPWRWTPWQFATDKGRFNGRWDDELAGFRTLYTAETLLGCFLELLAHLQPDERAWAELDAIEDDDQTAARFVQPQPGTVDLSWLEHRCYARGYQVGTYAEVTYAESLTFLKRMGVFDRLGIPPRDVDVSILKDPRRRTVTRTIARYLFELRNANRQPLVDGVAFRSRLGDDIRLWAVFERSEAEVSELITPAEEAQAVTEDTPALLRAFEMLGLHWAP